MTLYSRPAGKPNSAIRRSFDSSLCAGSGWARHSISSSMPITSVSEVCHNPWPGACHLRRPASDLGETIDADLRHDAVTNGSWLRDNAAVGGCGRAERGPRRVGRDGMRLWFRVRPPRPLLRTQRTTSMAKSPLLSWSSFPARLGDSARGHQQVGRRPRSRYLLGKGGEHSRSMRAASKGCSR
jgi:hypothetical protein